MSDSQPRWIAGFWRRPVAFFVDMLFLGIVGISIGGVLGERLDPLGSWGRLIGLAVAVGYGGLLNSRLSNGQTLGKKLLKIRVVDASGNGLSPGRSLLRSAVLMSPLLLPGVPIVVVGSLSLLDYLWALILFGAHFSLVYLYFFNRRTRQSLHDLLAGSYVVNARQEHGELQACWRGHFVAVGVLLLASLSAPLFLSSLGLEAGQLRQVQMAVMEHEGVREATVTVSRNKNFSMSHGYSDVRYMAVLVRVAEPEQVSDEPLARALAKAVVLTSSEVLNLDRVVVRLVYGYDLGIWGNQVVVTYTYLPAHLAMSPSEPPPTLVP